MRIVLLIALTIGVQLSAIAQIFNPVAWSFDTEQLSGNTFDLIFKAEIDDKWAVYSQFLEGDDGPIPTTFMFDEGSGYNFIDNVRESDNAKTFYDPIFEMQLTKFFKYAEFRQKVQLDGKEAKVSGFLTFMTCDDERCLPPKDVEFDFSLHAGKAGKDDNGSDQGMAAPDDSRSDIAHTGVEIAPMEGLEGGIPGGSGQMYDPVKWSFEVNELTDSTAVLEFVADIQEGWHIYTQHIDDEGDKPMPAPTGFYFTNADHYRLIGETSETALKTDKGFDKFFDVVLVKLKEQARFTQKVTFPDNTRPVTGELEFMACNASMCLPPAYVDFRFDLTGTGTVGQVLDRILDEGELAGLEVVDQIIPSIRATYEDPIGDCGQESGTKDKSLLVTFILGFLGGLLALLTPCVFPMIPLTVSYFSKDTKRKGLSNGLIYGLSIIVIYVALGILITAIFGETALNALSTNWIANTLFFLIFVAFAFSFFGYYEITLPSSWANKSDSMADKGGLIGIFFMAFTLAIVSFSCTGPIIGTAIVQSATSTTGPFVVMLGFSTALALPFGLFAAFPAWLNSLPRSGSWMNSVKVILGFLELALAFKFLSVADMTSHWDFLKYELFLGIWIVIAVAMALYLFGVIKFPHDSPFKRLSLPRLTLALAMSGLALYLVTGFLYNERTKTYDALPLLSGLAPPAQYNFFIPSEKPDADIKSKYPSYSKCANNLDCFKDYHEGMAYAREVNKPVILDFTGYGCVNCRKTEEHIWIKDKVWSKLKNKYVLVSLYVDDREPLEQMLYSETRNEKLRNVGNKWADFQIVNFKQNSQPLYVLLTPDQQVIAKPRGYKEGVDDYAQFLECGLVTFNEHSELMGSKE